MPHPGGAAESNSRRIDTLVPGSLRIFSYLGTGVPGVRLDVIEIVVAAAVAAVAAAPVDDPAPFGVERAGAPGAQGGYPACLVGKKHPAVFRHVFNEFNSSSPPGRIGLGRLGYAFHGAFQHRPVLLRPGGFIDQALGLETESVGRAHRVNLVAAHGIVFRLGRGCQHD